MIFEKGSIRRSLRYSIWDGVFASMMSGVGDCYLIPYGIALGATAMQVAFLASVPMLIASVFQLQSARITQSIGSRTKLINRTVFFHAVSWAPIILIPYLLSGKTSAPLGPWVLLAAATLFVCFGAFATAAWQSLMSDYIPVQSRGRYFGWRNRIQGIVTVTVSIIAGLVLNHFKDNEIAGFTVILTFAMVSRFLSWACLTQMAEPFRHTAHDEYFSFMDFLKGIRSRNFARFVFFVSLMSFVVNISSPLLSVFLLKDIHFNYVQYMVVVTAAALSNFSFQTLWGKYADRFGNVKVIKIAGWGIAVIPVLWLFSQGVPYLVAVQIFAGFFWGGFNLLVTNFAMEAVTPAKKIRCLSYLSLMNSVAVFLGAAFGGWLIRYLPPVYGYSYLALFLISCVGRVCVMGVLSRLVREVRAV